MSFHFTQICAFLTYSIRFMGYCLCFIGAKIGNFPEWQVQKCFFCDDYMSSIDKPWVEMR